LVCGLDGPDELVATGILALASVLPYERGQDVRTKATVGRGSQKEVRAGA